MFEKFGGLFQGESGSRQTALPSELDELGQAIGASELIELLCQQTEE